MSYLCSCCGQEHDGVPDLAFLEPTDHPLSQAQRDGLDLDAIWTFVHEHTKTA